MFEYLLNTEQKKLRDEARDFVKSIPGKMILDMEADAAETGAKDEKIFE